MTHQCTLVANIPPTRDRRPAGAPHAATGTSVNHLTRAPDTATTALTGRCTYEGWPATVDDPQDHA